MRASLRLFAVIVLGLTAGACGGSTTQPENSRTSATLATDGRTVAVDKSAYTVFPDADAGADPSANARWSDGMPVVADDVVASWRLSVDKSLQDPARNGYPQGYLTRIGSVRDVVHLWWIDPERSRRLDEARRDQSIQLGEGPSDDKYWLEFARLESEGTPGTR